MRQSIRALGWAITISMLILFAFLATAVYSVFQTALIEQGIRFGEFQPHFSNNTLVLSIPITVNNTGYYDITDFNITTTLKDFKGTTLTSSSTFIREIKKGSTEPRLHNISLGLAAILSNSYLLFNDSELKIDVSMGFRYAYALALHLAMINTSIPWGAPLHDIALREVRLSSFNGTHLVMQIFLELENHSFFDVTGDFYLKVYNEDGGYIGSGRGTVDVPSYSRLDRPVEVAIKIEDLTNYTGKGYVEVYFEIPMVDYILKLGRMPYG